MNKDQVEGKVKDMAGRAERQVGEWTDDPKKQVHGAAKQGEGKVQHAYGDAQEAVKDANRDADKQRTEQRKTEAENDELRRKAS